MAVHFPDKLPDHVSQRLNSEISFNVLKAALGMALIASPHDCRSEAASVLTGRHTVKIL